jgi:hypothetical protein
MCSFGLSALLLLFRPSSSLLIAVRSCFVLLADKEQQKPHTEKASFCP